MNAREQSLPSSDPAVSALAAAPGVKADRWIRKMALEHRMI